jgi:hypothetical protein
VAVTGRRSASSPPTRKDVTVTIRRLLLATTTSALLTVVLTTGALAAGGNGRSSCSISGAPNGFDGDWDPAPGNVGEVLSWVARNIGFSGEENPGQPPEVPFIIGCNPTAGD